MKALVLLLATAGACFGWPLFEDKPRAGMALAYVLVLVGVCLLGYVVWREARRSEDGHDAR